MNGTPASLLPPVGVAVAAGVKAKRDLSWKLRFPTFRQAVVAIADQR
ncbi:MAG: hypothetical protein ACRDQW_12980 [Haloechinothrix sp.]